MYFGGESYFCLYCIIIVPKEKGEPLFEIGERNRNRRDIILIIRHIYFDIENRMKKKRRRGRSSCYHQLKNIVSLDGCLLFNHCQLVTLCPCLFFLARHHTQKLIRTWKVHGDFVLRYKER